MKKRVLSMLVVLGIFVSMLSGISVSAADPFEYDFFVDGWRVKDNVTGVAQLEGGIIKSDAAYATKSIASNAFGNTLRDTTVVFTFKFKAEHNSGTDQISEMYVKNGISDSIDSTANMPAFAIKANGDFGFYSDPGVEGQNAWNNLVTPDDFKGYGHWDTWYQIDSIYDLSNGKVKYYVDGELLGEGNGPTYLNCIMLVAGQNAPRGNSYYKDITIRELGEFITLTKDETNSTEDTVAVKVSEPLVSTSQFKIYDVETLEAVDVAPIKIDELTYSFDISGLKYGAEYKVSIPAGVSGLYGNTTKASDVYFNIADETALVGTTQGTPGGQIFEENFNMFSSSAIGANISSTDRENIGVVADATGRDQWEKFGDKYAGKIVTGFNTYAYNHALRIDAWQRSANGQTGVKSKINTKITDSDVEITFDAESQNPEANTIANFFEFGVYDSVANLHPVFRISGETVSVCKNLQNSELIETSYKNKNQLSSNQSADFLYHTSYKVVLKMAENTAELYAKINGEYTKIGSTTINATLAANGFSDIVFRMEKAANGGLAQFTATYIDNVAVVTGPTPAPANFADNFSSYKAVTTNAGESNESTNVVGDKWELTNANAWGANAYVETNSGNNALKIDIWQSSKEVRKGVKSKMSENIKDGVVEIMFDAASQNPAGNAVDNNFQMVVYDTRVSEVTGDATKDYAHPFLHVKGSEISYYDTLTENSTNLKPASYTRENSITEFTSYKAVLDMDAKTAKLYAKVNGSYIEIGSTTINAALAENGFAEVGFRMWKSAIGSNAVVKDIMSYVDNVEVYIKENVSVPVVKSVRFDSKGASDAVDLDTKEIKIYFNTDMNEDTLGGILIDGAVYSGAYSADEKAYVITVSSLIKDTNYIIYVPTTVESANGIALGREYNGVFHTEKGKFEVTSFTLKEGNDDATYAGTAAGDTLTAAVTIKNQAGREGSYVLIYAVYDGNRLEKVDYVQVPFDTENEMVTKDIDFVIPETENELDVKVMLWENFASIRPILKAIDLKELN